MTPNQHAELVAALRSLGLTPAQQAELLDDSETAWEWLQWLREQSGIRNPAALLLSKFRSGTQAPDPSAWRGDSADAGPNYHKLLKAATALVNNTGHEYDESDLIAELEDLETHPRVGNGATLTDDDRRRLLGIAQRKREAHEAKADERKARDDAITLNLWVGLVRDRKLTPAKASELVHGYFAHDPEMRDRILEAISDRKQVAA